MRSPVDRAAPWVHALIVSVTTGIATWAETGQTSKAAFIGAIAYGVARGAGWFVLRFLRPRNGFPPNLFVLRKNVERFARDIHKMSNRATVMLAELEWLEHDTKDRREHEGQ